MPTILLASCCGCDREERVEQNPIRGFADYPAGWVKIRPAETSQLAIGTTIGDLICDKCLSLLPPKVATRMVEISTHYADYVAAMPPIMGGPRPPMPPRPPRHLKPA